MVRAARALNMRRRGPWVGTGPNVSSDAPGNPDNRWECTVAPISRLVGIERVFAGEPPALPNLATIPDLSAGSNSAIDWVHPSSIGDALRQRAKRRSGPSEPPRRKQTNVPDTEITPV